MVEMLQYPEYRLEPDSIKDTKKIYDEIRRNEIQSSDLAKMLGYSGPTSGKFYERLNSMLMYGLLEGRGRYRVTELGQEFAYPMGDDAYKKSLYRKAVLNVPLWRNIYEIHKNDLPQNFWYVLKQFTNADPADIHKYEDEIKRRYLEDISLIRDDRVESAEPHKSYSLGQVTNNRSMAQQLVLDTNDSGRFILNIGGKNWDIEVYDKDSLEASIGALNLLAKKFQLKFEAKKLQEETNEQTRTETPSPSSLNKESIL